MAKTNDISVEEKLKLYTIYRSLIQDWMKSEILEENCQLKLKILKSRLKVLKKS